MNQPDHYQHRHRRRTLQSGIGVLQVMLILLLVGSTIAAGAALVAAGDYSATSRRYRDEFANRYSGGFPAEAKRLEEEIVDNARRGAVLGGFPDETIRAVAKDLCYREASTAP